MGNLYHHKKLKILYFSKVDWFWTKQRPQQLAEQLAIDNKVDFLAIRSWRYNANVLIPRDNQDTNKKFIKVNDNLNVYRKRVIPKAKKLGLIKVNNFYIKSYLYRLYKMNNYDVIVCTAPNQIHYLDERINCPIVYDCMDNERAMENDTKQVYSDEKLLVHRCNWIISSSELLKMQLKKLYSIEKKISVVNNGVDFEFFNKFRKYNYKNNITPIIGYVGSVDSWFDFEAVNYIAKKCSDYRFEIYGPINKQVKSRIKLSPPNVYYYGSLNYLLVPQVIDSFNIAIMPFKNNEIVKTVNPVKLYEYLALGKNIIANYSEENLKFSKYIEFYTDKQSLYKKIVELSNAVSSQDIVNTKIIFAQNNSWKKRANLFLDIIMRSVIH
ncbi:MAG: hypothetical protein J6584_04730 [Lactobacillus sp.]|uniref:hypothetical protein n=1 Tax=Bombilactobacillus bombi TaxID=1303590 RepID=UPI0035E97F29|nr:hypothetical protein [Lactobacillus sp.]